MVIWCTMQTQRFHPSTQDISATPDKSNFVSIVVTARSRECRKFQVTEWCVFCAEIISHLYEVFWWRRDIGKSRFFYSVFVIYMCIKIFSLTFSPVTSSWLDGRRKATVFPRDIHTQSCMIWTIDQKSSLPACISCPTLTDLNNKREKSLT